MLHLVAPSGGTAIAGQEVNAVACLLKEWLPFLKESGLTRRPKCEASLSTKFRCQFCPPLFPTFPSHPSGPVRPMDISALTSALKRFAVLTDKKPEAQTSGAARPLAETLAKAAKAARTLAPAGKSGQPKTRGEPGRPRQLP